MVRRQEGTSGQKASASRGQKDNEHGFLRQCPQDEDEGTKEVRVEGGVTGEGLKCHVPDGGLGPWAVGPARVRVCQIQSSP